MQFVSFVLGEETFCVEVARTREILNLIPVTKVPQTPDYMLGVINLRGQVVPVVDMRLKLGMSSGMQTENSCIIVLEVLCGDEKVIVGALADAVSEVLDIMDEQIEPAPRIGTKLNTEFIQGMGKVNDQFLILLDIDNVFNADDVALVSGLGQADVADHEDRTPLED